VFVDSQYEFIDVGLGLNGQTTTSEFNNMGPYTAFHKKYLFLFSS